MITIYSLLFLILPFFGWVVLRTLLDISSIVYLFPFSFVFGTASFLILIYSLAYFIGVQNATLVSILILFLISITVGLFFKEKVFKFENTLEFKQLIILSIICTFILFFTYLTLNKSSIWDFGYHLSQASFFVTSDKFPTGTYSWPSIFIPYHYGFDIYSALLSKLMHISVLNSFHFVVLTSVVVIFFSCFAIVYFFTEGKSFLQALAGSIAFYFAGNLLWLDSLIRYIFKIEPVTNSWSLFESVCALGMHGSFMSDLGSAGIMFASITLGVQFFLLLLFLYFNFVSKTSSFIYLIPILITSLALFHSAEWILYIFMASLLLSSMLFLIFKNQSNYKSLVLKNLICLICFIAIIVFNGLATTIISQNYTYIPDFFIYLLKSNPFQFEVFGRFGDLNHHRIINFFSWDFLCELGLQFIFSIFVVYWLIRKNFVWTNFILSFILISYIIPFFVLIKTSPPDILRLYHPAHELLTCLFILCIFNMAFVMRVRFLNTFKNILFVVIIISQPVITLVLGGIFSPSIYLNHDFINKIQLGLHDSTFNSSTNLLLSLRGKLDADKSFTEIVEYLQKHSQSNECGLSINSLPFGYVGIPCYSINGSSLSRKATYITLLQTLDPYLIKELNIKWLFLDSRTAPFVDLGLIEKLIQEGVLKPLIEIEDKYLPNAKAMLLEFTDQEKYISTFPRRAYWTFNVYLSEKVAIFPESYNTKVMLLFQSEIDATKYLKRIMEIDHTIKKNKLFVNAFSEDILKQQATIHNCVLKYF